MTESIVSADSSFGRDVLPRTTSTVSGSGATPICPAPRILRNGSGEMYRNVPVAGHDVFVPEQLADWFIEGCDASLSSSSCDEGRWLDAARPFQGFLYRYKWDERRGKPFFVDLFDRKVKRWDLPDVPENVKSTFRQPRRVELLNQEEVLRLGICFEEQSTRDSSSASLLSTLTLSAKYCQLESAAEGMTIKRTICLGLIEGLNRGEVTSAEDSGRGVCYLLFDEGRILRRDVAPDEMLGRIQIEDAERCIRLVLSQRLAALAAQNRTVSAVRKEKFQRLTELLIELGVQESYARDSVTRTEAAAFRAVRSGFLKGAAEVATRDAFRVRFHEDALAAATKSLGNGRRNVANHHISDDLIPDQSSSSSPPFSPHAAPRSDLEKEVLLMMTNSLVDTCLLQRVADMYDFVSSTAHHYQQFAGVLLGKRLPASSVADPYCSGYSADQQGQLRSSKFEIGRQVDFRMTTVQSNPQQTTNRIRPVDHEVYQPDLVTGLQGIAERKYNIRNGFSGRPVLQTPCPFASWASGRLGAATMPSTITSPNRIVPFPLNTEATKHRSEKGKSIRQETFSALAVNLSTKAASVATAAAAIAEAEELKAEPLLSTRELFPSHDALASHENYRIQRGEHVTLATQLHRIHKPRRWSEENEHKKQADDDDDVESPRRSPAFPQPMKMMRNEESTSSTDESSIPSRTDQLVWDFERCRGCAVSTDGLTCTATVVPGAKLISGRRVDAYGSGSIGTGSGCFAWAVLVLQVSASMRVGMSTRFFVGETTDDPSFLYCSDGSLSSTALCDTRQAFGPPLTNGDKLTFVVNFFAGTIAVWLNDQSLGVAFVFQQSRGPELQDGGDRKEVRDDDPAEDQSKTKRSKSSRKPVRDESGRDDDLEPLFPVVLFGARGDCLKLASARFGHNS